MPGLWLRALFLPACGKVHPVFLTCVFSTDALASEPQQDLSTPVCKVCRLCCCWLVVLCIIRFLIVPEWFYMQVGKATREALRLGPHQDASCLRLGSQCCMLAISFVSYMFKLRCVFVVFNTIDVWYCVFWIRTHAHTQEQSYSTNRALESNQTVIKQYNRALKKQSDSTQTVHASARKQSDSTTERSVVQSERSDVISQQSSST